MRSNQRLTGVSGRRYLTAELVNRTVHRRIDRLGTTFAALADPTRPAIPARLARGEVRELSFDRMENHRREPQTTEKDMAAGTGAVTGSAARELVITRAFDAPRPLVFKVWTRPEHLVRWWGPRGYTTPSCKMDVRPGGAWRLCMRSPEGTLHWLQCVYREVVEPERLAFSWAWEDADGKPGHETLVTVTFAEQDGKTRLIVHQAVFESDTARDRHHEGWSGSLDRLEDYLASL
jgi:uncharacterized protein YndB with AHSA1/START domain